MQEIKLEGNESNYKVFADELPLPEYIPKEVIELLAKAIQGDVFDSLAKKSQRKKYYQNSKAKKLEISQS